MVARLIKLYGFRRLAVITIVVLAAGMLVLAAACSEKNYTVTFVDDDGNVIKEVETFTHEDGIRFVYCPRDMSKEGYDFSGWTLDPADTDAEFVGGNAYGGGNIENVSCDLTATAVWEKETPPEPKGTKPAEPEKPKAESTNDSTSAQSAPASSSMSDYCYSMKSYGEQMQGLLNKAVSAAESGDVSAAESAYRSAESIGNAVAYAEVPDGAEELHRYYSEAILDYVDSIYWLSEGAKSLASGDVDGFNRNANFAAEDMQSGTTNLNKAAPLLDELIQQYK